MDKTAKRLVWGILIAAVLWFLMFSPWTSGHIGNFWVAMAVSGAILTAYSIAVFPAWKNNIRLDFKEKLIGAGIAVLFWGVFWVGDKVSQLLFDFARPQVNLIYTLKEGANPVAIVLLLLFLVGPAEEIFWRGFVQEGLMSKIGPWRGWIAATLIYALVHIWSMNFMLVMAALVIGALWGFIYMKWPEHLGAVIVSHALWDVAAFVVFPF